MKSLMLAGLFLVACGSTDGGSAQPEETGGSSAQQQQLTTTGGESSASTEATGGRSAVPAATGGATAQATTVRAPTGGSGTAMGGSAGAGGSACKPNNCSVLNGFVGAKDLSNYDQIKATGTWSGQDGCGGPLLCACSYSSTAGEFVCT